MIFLLTIQTEFVWQLPTKDQFYYSILGLVLNFFSNDQQVYENILKISYSIKKNQFLIFLSIYRQENFKKVVDYILKNVLKQFSIDWYRLQITGLKFDFEVLDLDKVFDIQPFDKKSFWLNFLSPTMIRQRQKVYLLPTSWQFLFSTINRAYNQLNVFKEKFDLVFGSEFLKNYKNRLKENVLVKNFNIKTKIVEIKKVPRSWCVWKVSYIVYDFDSVDKKLLKLLNINLKLIPFLGIGSWVKLWLGNVEVF